MSHSHVRKQFSRAASPRLSRVVAVSAGVLAVTATAGLMFSQVGDGEAPKRSAAVSLMGMTGTNGAKGATGTNGNLSPDVPVPAAPAAPAEKVLDHTLQLQPNFYYCGPAATRIALSVKGRLLSQDEIARKLGTDTGGTDSAHDITRALNDVLGGKVYQTREIPAYPATPAQMDQLQADAVRSISSGRALVTNIAGYATDQAGGYHDYGGGHYVSVVGYKDQGRSVKVADPANPNGDGTYWMSTISMANWIAARGYSY